MNKIYKLILLLPVLLFAATGIAATITGTIKYPDADEPMIGATVRLLSAKDSVMLKGTATDIDGRYSLTNVAQGRYILVVTMVGFEETYRNIDVTAGSKDVTVPDIKPQQQSIALKEAVVTGVASPVIVKQDTIEFNAGSYHTAPNAVVEDLIKRLPGVEVGSDGSISTGGKTVTKVLVNGKEFFADDPKMATKNLPADMVDKVQIVDRKSDLARLTGVDDGEEETVINLTVKKNMQNGVFGNVTAGYGNKDRYMACANISWFNDGNQVTLIGGANNINDMRFTDQGRGRFRRMGGDGGIVNTQAIGVNFNLGKTDDLRVGGNVLYTHTDRDSRNRYQRQYLFPDSTSYENGNRLSRDRGHNLRADLRLQWNIDPNNTIDFRPRFSYNHNDSERNDSTYMFAGDPARTPVNRDLGQDKSRGDSYDFGAELIYTHKFAEHPGRSFSLQGKYNLSNTRQRTVSLSDILFYLQQDESELLNRFIRDHNWSNSVEGQLTWTEPLGKVSNGNFLNFAYQVNYRWNNADKLTYDLPDGIESSAQTLLQQILGDVPDDGAFNPELSNSFRNRFMNQRLQVGFKRIHSLYNLEAGMMVTPSMTQSSDLLNPERNLPARWVWNVSPYMRFRYKFSKQRNLSVDYRGRTSQASISQLQPVPDTSDPLNIIVGNPELKPSFTQSIMARYSDYNAGSQQSLMAMMRVGMTSNQIVSNTTFNDVTGGRTTTYENINGVWQVMAMGMLNRPIAPRHWRLSVNLMTNYNRNAGYNNGLLNRSDNLMLRPEVALTYSTNICQIELRPRYSLQYTHNSIANQPNRTVHGYGATFNASVYLPFGLNFDTDLTYSGTSGYAAGYDVNQWMWNAELSYSLLRDKSLTLGVKVYDILHQQNNISRDVTANYILDQQYNTLTRYVMFTVSYKFNTMTAKKRRMPGADFDPDDMPPPPPGDGNGPPIGPPPGGGPPPGFGGPPRF